MINNRALRDIFSLSLPAVGEMLLYMLILIFDTSMVGKYGGNCAVSAVGLCSEIIYSINSVLIDVGIAIAVASFVARKVGEKNYKIAEEYASIALYMSLIIALFVSFATVKFSSRILPFAGAKGIVLELGGMYLRIAVIGMYFRMVSSVLCGIVRGYGNTKTPLHAASIILIINILLDWILIFGHLGSYEYGIRGSAIAYTVSQFLGFLYMGFYIIVKSQIKIKLKYIMFFSFDKLKEFLLLSIPTSLEDAAFNTSRMLCLFMILHNGTAAFASNQIATTVENISFMQGYGFSVAATTLVGIKVGQKRYREAKSYAYTCAFCGAMSMIFCAVFFLLIPEFLITLFISSTETQVVNFGSQCLRVGAIAQPFMGVSLIFAGAMKGSGDTGSPFLVSFFTSWLIRLPLMFYFIYLLKLPVVYVWIVTTVQWCIDGLLMFFMFEIRFRLLSKA